MSPRAKNADERFMDEALRLARKGEGKTPPNPMVGAVIVKGGKVIARGYHHSFGKPHAEADALRKLERRHPASAKGFGAAKGATLYVNLEPCNHSGKTPPCASAIVRAGIARVVCAARDPNTLAHGGVEAMRKAGIKVSVGVREKEARELNAIFYTFHEKGRPLVSLKFAVSLDGKMATRTRDSGWITNESARAYARKLRGLHQAVIVGIGTVLADDPRLTARMKGLDEPFRVILDPRLCIPLNARVLQQGKAIVFASTGADTGKRKALERKGVQIIAFPGMHIAPKKILTELKKLGITSVLVEGGGEVLGGFLDAKLVDKVYAFIAPVIIGGKDAVSVGGRGVTRVSEALRLLAPSVTRFGNDLLVSGIPT